MEGRVERRKESKAERDSFLKRGLLYQPNTSANAAHLRSAQSPGVAQSLRALFAEIGVDYGPYRIKKKK